MLFIVFFCVVVVLLGLFASFGRLKYGLEWAFILIILFSAFRFDYGNDYLTYYSSFKEIAKYPSLGYIVGLYDNPFGKYEGMEAGWLFLNWIFRPLGFKWLIIFTSILTNVVYYRFIKSYVPQKWYWLAVFTYIFDTNLFFIPLSMMRQSIGMVLFVIAFKSIKEKKIIPSLLIILVAAFFHKSALVLLPFVFVSYLDRLNARVMAIIYLGIFLALLFVKDITANVVESALSSNIFDSYGGYFEKFESADSFGLGFVSRLLTFFVPFLFFYSDPKEPSSNRTLAFIAGVSFLIAPFTLVLGFLGRIDYYFAIYNIAAVPILYSWIKKGLLKKGLVALYMAYILYSYYQFFTEPNWTSFTHYQTIFGVNL